ncbi:hypothetical protein [Bradyrhizobium sp. McL0616]|uniref:hypothetical protein n=1 Tax=Bradyrhizobium sp. McL0616 TaxID=3415674 RepID=UPI003CF50183
MSRHIAPAQDAADGCWEDFQHRCLSCNGIIEGLGDQDLGIGLNIKLGLVSDECALICNGCTAKLIETRPPAGMPVTRRR